MKIAFIGYGNVGGPLAARLQELGHDVTLAARDPNSEGVRNAKARNASLGVADPVSAARSADVIFLATPFDANEAAVTPLVDELKGKILVDCTNPVGPGLKHGLDSVRSGTEFLQQLLPQTHVVKAFTIYGYENFEDSSYPGYGVRPVMLFCGNDAKAKATIAPLIDQLGFEPLDVGGADRALHLEHMTLLWVRMVRVDGHPPGLVWAALKR
jgi:predicted dinucleotide-binding enzyme